MAAQSLRQLLQLDGASLSDGSLLLSLHPDGSRLAVARGPALFVCPLLPASSTHVLAAREPGTADGLGGDVDQRLQQQALRERQATHGSAGPRTNARPASPRHFTCPVANVPWAVSQDDITALAWLAFARPPSSVAATQSAGSPEHGRSCGGAGGGGVADGVHRLQPGRAVSDRRRTNSSGGSGGVFASIQVMLEDHDLLRQQPPSPSSSPSTTTTTKTTKRSAAAAAVPQQAPHPGYSVVVLLSGTRGGALQLHDADSGAVLLRQQLHSGPVVSLAVRTWRMGLNSCEAVEDVTVGWADAVARLAAWELRAAATTCYAAAAAAAEARARGGAGSGQARFGLWGSSSSAPPGPDIKPLAAQKWEVPHGAARGRSCVVCCGQRPRDLYSLLQGIGAASATATGKTIFLAGGHRPACLAALEVDEQSSGGGGALSYISSVATSVWGLARTARNVAAAPLSLREGLKYFVMNPLQLAGSGAGIGGSSAATGAAPLASFPDPTAGQRLPCTGVWLQHRDDGRAVLSLAPAPHGSLVAAVDSLGRLLLVETGAMLVTRMWKGYRDAQVAWMEVRASGVARLLARQRAERCSDGHEGQQVQQQSHQLCAAQPSEAPCNESSGEAPCAGADGTARAGQQESPGGHGHGHRHEQAEGPGREGSPREIHGSHAAASSMPPQAAAAASAQHASSLQHLVAQPQQPAQHRQQRSEVEDRSGDGDGGSGGIGGGIGEEYVLLLAVYAPRRQTLELWFPLQGERLAAVAVPPKARLLQRGGGGNGGGELGTWRVADAASAASPALSPAGCMICFAGAAPRLRLGEEMGPAGPVGGVSEGLELLDVASVFGLS